MRVWVGAVGVTGLALAALSVDACGGDPSGSTPTDPVTDARSASDAKPARDASRPDAPPDARPDGRAPALGALEDGWEWWTDFDPTCPFRIAKPEGMPPPFEWEACSPGVSTAGVECRWLKPRDGGRYIGVERAMPFGTEPLQFTVYSRDADGAINTSLIGSPDGPMRFAARSPLRCGLGATTVHQDRIMFLLYDSHTPSSEPTTRTTAIATLGERPRVANQIPISDPIYPSCYPSSQGLLCLLSNVTLYDWTTLSPTTLVDSSSVYQPGVSADLGRDGRILIHAGNRARLRPFAYAVGQTPIDLFGPTFVEGRGITDVATDGNDWAWVERIFDPGSSVPRVFASYTAPFSLDPAAIAATRRALPFRPDQSGTTRSGLVGCGRWARHISAVPDRNGVPAYRGLQVTRLSDGRQWLLPSELAHIQWGDLLGVTCDEMFVVANTQDPALGNVPNVARIRFDSLP